MRVSPICKSYVMQAITCLDKWVDAEEVASCIPLTQEQVIDALRELHKERELSHFKDYFGNPRYAVLPELKGVPFVGRGVI